VLFDAGLPTGIISTTQIKVPVTFVEFPADDTIIDYAGNVNLEIADKIRQTIFFRNIQPSIFAGSFGGMMTWAIGPYRLVNWEHTGKPCWELISMK